MAFFAHGSLLNAQSPIDSLQQLINTTDDAVERLQHQQALAKVLITEQPDEAVTLLKASLQAAATLGDPIQVRLLRSLGEAYEVRQQLDSALLLFEQLEELAQGFDDQAYVAYSLMDQGFIYNLKNELEKGLDLSRAAYRIAEKADNKRVLFGVANALGRSYSFVGKYDSASLYFEQVIDLELNEFGADGRTLFELYTNVGNNYARAGQIDEWERSYKQAQVYAEAINDSSAINFCYRNYAVTYYFNGQYPNALAYLHKAVDYLQNSSLLSEQITNLDYLGDVYFAIEDYENTILYWQRAIGVWQQLHEEQDNPDLLFKIGKVLLLQEKYKASLSTLLEAEQLKKKAGQYVDGDWHWHIGQAHQHLEQYDEAIRSYNLAMELSPFSNSELINSRSLLGLGEISEKRAQYQAAKSYYQQVYKMTSSDAFNEHSLKATAGLYRIYKRENNSEVALTFLERSKTIQDSLFNEKNTREIALMQAGFEFEQEKQELAYSQTQELDRQSNIRRILWAALLVTAILLLIAVLYFRNKQKANKELGRLNAEIRAQKDKLEELDASKSRFFTNISHEFRTPLTIIKGMVEKVREKPDVHLEDGTLMIRRNALNLLDLVNQILDLRKLESKELQLHLQQGDIIAYLKYITESHSSYAAQEALLLHFETAVPALQMDYDAEKLLRVVSNLLSNAIKFTPEQGSIYFRVRQDQLGDIPALQLQVEDTGIGISEDNLPYIFDRFYQEDNSPTRSGEGTGIGLALTKELVTLMGGSITAQSIPDQGSTFSILLPISTVAQTLHQPFTEVDTTVVMPADLEQGQLESPVSTSAKSLELAKLLIVEDNVDVQRYLQAALKDYYDIEIAANGAAGIARAIETIPDLIISDVMMPEKNGYELTAALKEDERTNHIPIILLTAKSDIDSKISGLEKGADAYLAKPFEERELLVRIDQLLALRKKLQARYANMDFSATHTSPEVIDPLLQKLHDFVEEHISEADLNMERISKVLAMSRTQIFRKLKALTGQSPTRFIRAIRLSKGKQLLATTDMTISEVAYEVGFTSLSYFSKAFVEEFGTRPSEIRS